MNWIPWNHFAKVISQKLIEVIRYFSVNWPKPFQRCQIYIKFINHVFWQYYILFWIKFYNFSQCTCLQIIDGHINESFGMRRQGYHSSGSVCLTLPPLPVLCTGVRRANMWPQWLGSSPLHSAATIYTFVFNNIFQNHLGTFQKLSNVWHLPFTWNLPCILPVHKKLAL